MPNIAPAPLKLEDCVIKVEALQEDTAPEHHARVCGFSEDWVKSVREMMAKNRIWGWCMVKVTVEHEDYPEITGSATLCGCSHRSKKDFINNSGYYEDLVNDALAETQTVVYDKYHELQNLVDDGILEIT